MENIPYFPQGNPFKAVNRFPKEVHSRYIPPISDFWKVYHATDCIQNQIILLTIFKTGARPIEAFRLKYTDLDFDNGRIQLWSRKGKNHDYANRWVPMDEELKQSMKAWVTRRLNVTGIKARSHVFISLYFNNFGEPFQERRYFMRELCKKANVKPFGLYGLRHLRAAIEYSKDKRIRKLQQLLGHQKASTTDHYLQKHGLDMIDLE